MEQHPVPRNISSFQFHLVGDMTVRQFGYLTGGAIVAFLIYKISPFPTAIKFALAGVSGFAGFAFAFLPVAERPLDKWIVAFIKSIYSPTQYLWKKENIPPAVLLAPVIIRTTQQTQIHTQVHQDVQNKLRTYLASLPSSPHQTINMQEKNYIDKTLSLFESSPVTTPSPKPPAPTHPIAPQSPPMKITPHPQSPPPKTPQPQPVLQPIAQTPSPKKEEAIDLQKQLADLIKQKDTLTNELAKLRQEQQQSPNIIKPIAGKDTEPTIKTISPKAAVNEVGMPSLPQTPNMVIGVIKDSQKRILPNIIITIKDKKTMPLRALKTNKLGQFSVATPLPNGTYYLEFEDPLKRYIFDIAEITLSGKIFLPIEIIAKGEREVMREKLTKEIFGNMNANI